MLEKSLTSMRYVTAPGSIDEILLKLQFCGSQQVFYKQQPDVA